MTTTEAPPSPMPIWPIIAAATVWLLAVLGEVYGPPIGLSPLAFDVAQTATFGAFVFLLFARQGPVIASAQALIGAPIGALIVSAPLPVALIVAALPIIPATSPGWDASRRIVGSEPAEPNGRAHMLWLCLLMPWPALGMLKQWPETQAFGVPTLYCAAYLVTIAVLWMTSPLPTWLKWSLRTVVTLAVLWRTVFPDGSDALEQLVVTVQGLYFLTILVAVLAYGALGAQFRRRRRRTSESALQRALSD